MTVTSQISVLTVKFTGSFLEIQSHVGKINPIALKILIIQIILSYDKSFPILNKMLKISNLGNIFGRATSLSRSDF